MSSEVGLHASVDWRSIQLAVPDDVAFDHIDHLFGDVGGVVGQPLDVPGDEQQVDHVADIFGQPVGHGLLDAVVGLILDLVHLVIQRAAP